eukprot:COSAG01_NODE_792_length_13554_cov_13.811891_6_plen_298_part_00
MSQTATLMMRRARHVLATAPQSDSRLAHLQRRGRDAAAAHDVRVGAADSQGGARPSVATPPPPAARARGRTCLGCPDVTPVRVCDGTGAGGDHGIAHHKNWLRFPYDPQFCDPIVSTRTRTETQRADGLAQVYEALVSGWGSHDAEMTSLRQVIQGLLGAVGSASMTKEETLKNFGFYVRALDRNAQLQRGKSEAYVLSALLAAFDDFAGLPRVEPLHRLLYAAFESWVHGDGSVQLQTPASTAGLARQQGPRAAEPEPAPPQVPAWLVPLSSVMSRLTEEGFVILLKASALRLLKL